MHKTPTFFAFVFFLVLSHALYSQVISPSLTEIAQPQQGVHLNFSVGDTSLLRDLIHGDFFQSPLRAFFSQRDSTDDDFWSMQDSTDDSLLLDMKVNGFPHRKKHHVHSF